MNQAILEKSQELAQLISHSTEYIAMRAAEDAAAQDEAMTELFGQYNELHQQIEQLSMAENPDFDQMGALTREMEAVQAQLQAMPLAKAMQQARQGFAAMMQAVNAELSKVLSPQHSCEGDCSSCGGHCDHCH